MTVTFLREARSSLARRSSRRSRPAADETPVEAGRADGAGRGIFVTLDILALLAHIRTPGRPRIMEQVTPEKGQVGSMAAGRDKESQGSRSTLHWREQLTLGRQEA